MEQANCVDCEGGKISKAERERLIARHNHHDKLPELFNDVYKPLNGMTAQHRFLAFDVETYQSAENDNEFLCGAAYGDRIAEFFTDRESMIRFLLHRRFKNYWIFAHALHFDFFVLFGYDFTEYGFKGDDFCFRGSSLISVTYSDKYNERKFLDTMNYYPVKLETMGRMLGCPKLPQPKCWKRKPVNDAEMAELTAYNIRDAEICYKWISWFQAKLNGIGCALKPTIASTSMWYYRNRYQRELHYQPAVNIMDDMFNAYYGGRTEAFQRGHLTGYKIYVYDVNSMYPFAMTLEYPLTESLLINEKPGMDDVFEYHGVTKCDVVSPDSLYYPLLPVRKDGKLIFPLGKWKNAWYSNVELRKAAELGYNITPKFSYQYSENYFPFAVIQKELYRRRRHEKDISLVFKLIANSLYGKFAQRYDDTLVYRHISEFEELPPEFADIKDEFVILEESRKPAKFLNPIFSIYTAAYARLRLYAFLNKFQGFYCDTDSIFSYRKAEGSAELGDLKLEKTTNELVIVKPKVYFLKDELSGLDFVKAKGMKIRKKAEFDEMLKNKGFAMPILTKFKDAVRHEKRLFSEKTIFKRMALEDNKRHWNRQFSVNEWQDSEPVRLS